MQAANRTGAVDQQKVSFQVLVQRQIGTGPWKTVALSAKQTRTVYDNAYTNFTAIKVYWNGAANQKFRAMLSSGGCATALSMAWSRRASFTTA